MTKANVSVTHAVQEMTIINLVVKAVKTESDAAP